MYMGVCMLKRGLLAQCAQFSAIEYVRCACTVLQRTALSDCIV
jgi:hypothetical protein